MDGCTAQGGGVSHLSYFCISDLAEDPLNGDSRLVPMSDYFFNRESLMEKRGAVVASQLGQEGADMVLGGWRSLVWFLA